MKGCRTQTAPSTQVEVKRASSPQGLSIGEAARRSGLTASAIRFYERKGLLPKPERRSGQRRFDAADLLRLKLIKAARDGGVPLAALTASPAVIGLDAQDLRARLAHRRADIDRQIEQLNAQRARVDEGIACGCASLETCARLAESG
jgi:MerR family redox-sensitive transcriptional activator SoxR